MLLCSVQRPLGLIPVPVYLLGVSTPPYGTLVGFPRPSEVVKWPSRRSGRDDRIQYPTPQDWSSQAEPMHHAAMPKRMSPMVFVQSSHLGSGLVMVCLFVKKV